MKRGRIAVVLFLAATTVAALEPVEHHLRVELDPATSRLRVSDRIVLTPPSGGEAIEFLLNAALEITSSSVALEEVPLGDPRDLLGPGEEVAEEVNLVRYRLTAAPGAGLELAYGGAIDYGLSDQKEEYTRGFRETAGIVSEEGVYLTGGTFWYPWFGDEAAGFELEVSHPSSWRVVSQGSGPGDLQGRSVWRAEHPVIEGIYLVGGPLVLYRQAAGAVEAQVYLRQEDPALAARYLDTTGQYLEMYRRLLGDYPYGKFALVENFWETGYGMPSFTLLGPRVIRFPFILHSSYPHEILHNWWGNGVFVDLSQGNWCEGLTAYLADHLVKEQRGEAVEHRRATLQKYRDYVREGLDFPLVEFRSRHSAATEAVGYGKTLMGFHMLRRRLGDGPFVRALRRLYEDSLWRRASFADLEAAFEAEAREDLGDFFDPWIQRSGAPGLEVTVAAVSEELGGWIIDAELAQRQPGDPFPLSVPVAVETEAGLEITVVHLDGARKEFSIASTARPLRLQVDPWFDVFRLLDPRETPPSIGQIFGDEGITAVLPSAASAERQAAWRSLLEGWRSDTHAIEIVGDRELEELPADRSVWVVGRENLLAAELFGEPAPGSWQLGDDGVILAGEAVPFAGRSLVVIRRHPASLDKAVGWLAVDPEAAFPGMGRKLPHYGKYSYLAFEGDEPTNTVKGQWPASDSPLAVDLRPEGERTASLGAFPAQAREALAELPPAFSEKNLREHLTYLASPELEGRGVGTAGLDEAAAWIAERFAEYGLAPAGDDGGYYQRFTLAEGPDGAPREVANVVGKLAGAREEWRDQSVVLCAHYDHLGRGWPDVHQGDEGEIHPGADDNASGVAVLLELARTLAKAGPPPRTLVFAAFTAEEAGRAGSRHFVASHGELEGVRAVVNLDTVGRLGDGEVSILGTGTAEEWQHIFRGASFVTGVASRNVPASEEASDQMSFIERGIPGVQVFTRAHADYHRPTDTADKVDVAGLIKVTTLVKEAVVYLTERQEPLTATIAVEGGEAFAAGAPAPAAGGRRVRFGTIPDFAYPGPGARIDSVSPGSPAERAGLQSGDVLTKIDGEEVADLRGYSGILRALEPGQTVEVVVKRGEEELVLAVTVEAR